MKTKQTKSLAVFVKKECANCVGGQCCMIGQCLVLKGKPCLYFEKAVLGPVDYKFHQPGYDWGGLFDAYSAINGSYLSKQVKLRNCECGEPLLPGKRYCEKCKRKRARAARYQNKAKQRVSGRTKETT